MNLGGILARRESKNRLPYKRNWHIVEKVLIMCIIISSSFSDTGKIYEWDFCAASTNANYKKNIVVATSGDSANFGTSCDTTYAAENANSFCTASFYGIFVSHDATAVSNAGSISLYSAINIPSTRFKDHSTNTMLIRTYINPSKITSNTKLPLLCMGYCVGTAPNCNGFGLGFQFSSSQGTFQPLGYTGYNIDALDTLSTFAEGKAPILSSASWVDFSVSLTSSGASSTARLTFKAYKHKEEFDSGEVNVGEIKPGFSVSSISAFAMLLLNNLAMDVTIQSIIVYGGSKTYEYLEESYGQTPPEGLSVPPEYCSDASSELLLKGCTNKVGKKCKPNANCRCKDPKYQHELEARKITGIAIGVSFGVDIIIMVIIFFFIFI